MLVAAAGFRIGLCLEGKVKSNPNTARSLLAWAHGLCGDGFGKFSSTFLAPQRREIAVKPAHFDVLDKGLAKAPAAAFGFRFEGPKPGDHDRFGLPYFGLWQQSQSYAIDIALPEAPDNLLACIEQLRFILSDAPLIAGFAGYGFCPDPGLNIALYRAIEPSTRRFQAALAINIELFHVAMTEAGMGNGRRAGYLTEDDKPGLLDIGWLTLLGSRLAERLPAPGQIREELPPQAEVIEMPSGLMIRLGQNPVWGDADEDISAYHQAGRILHQLRYPDYFIGSLPFQGDEAGSKRYYWRFFPKD
ncbi:hypothetical protein [Terrihabitans sp. B22-R8]|uniref:hypothetical protein n=1 Tax=Terrihabitans sp. B22-R8 TaxID=3425128 RepID=UPI00403C3DC5